MISRPYALVQQFYDVIIRPHLPRKIGVYNGVAVRNRGLLDVTETRQDYEAPLVESLRNHVERGERVVVVGGGYGVSGVISARLVGSEGKVHIYEGSRDQYETIMETVVLNGVDDRTLVHHALVGPDVKLYSDAGNAETVDPVDLPDCDVLELDCEGAEIDILRNLEIRPRLLVVETHGFLGSPEHDVRAELDRLGYSVIDRGIENESDGVFILTSKLLNEM